MDAFITVAATYGVMGIPILLMALAVYCFKANPKDPWEED